jgi:hypothetical protein
MKTRIIIAAALIAYTVMLTLHTGLAQAQSPSVPSTPALQVAEDEGEAEAVAPAPGIAPQFVSESLLYAGSCIVGPQAWDIIFTCFGLGFPSANPTAVQCQLRNSPLDPSPYVDQFACQVLSTSPGSVTVRIRRMDLGTGGSGWVQDLRLHLLIVN